MNVLIKIKNKMSNNKYLILIYTLVVVLSGMSIYENIKYSEENKEAVYISSEERFKDKENSIKANIDYYYNYIAENLDKIGNQFKNRYTAVIKGDVYVGNNKKEIENNYYDLKFSVSKSGNGINIYINKLFKNALNENIYDDNYLAELVICINKIYNLGLNDNEIVEFKKYIKDIYLAIRTSYVENVDKSTTILIKKFNITSIIKDNIIVIEMA